MIMSETTPTVNQAKKTFPARMIDAANDISGFASTNNDTRLILCGVHFTEQYTEATDGTIAVRVPYLDEDGETGASLEDCVVPSNIIEQSLAISEKAKVCVSTEQSGETVFARSGKRQEVVIRGETVETIIPYPKTDKIFEVPEPKMKITIGFELLGRLCDYLRKHGCEANGITFCLTGELDSVTFTGVLKDGRKIKGVLMPWRVHND